MRQQGGNSQGLTHPIPLQVGPSHRHIQGELSFLGSCLAGQPSYRTIILSPQDQSAVPWARTHLCTFPSGSGVVHDRGSKSPGESYDNACLSLGIKEEMVACLPHPSLRKPYVPFPTSTPASFLSSVPIQSSSACLPPLEGWLTCPPQGP